MTKFGQLLEDGNLAHNGLLGRLGHADLVLVNYLDGILVTSVTLYALVHACKGARAQPRRVNQRAQNTKTRKRGVLVSDVVFCPYLVHMTRRLAFHVAIYKAWEQEDVSTLGHACSNQNRVKDASNRTKSVARQRA